ncbi:MAG: DUF1344 domain-containing protein [Mesorhizobium sp.]
MRKIILTAAASCLLAGSAFAATPHHSTGTIKEIDAKAMTLTLSNGSVYSLPHKFKTSSLKAGEKVRVAWDQTGQKKMAESVTRVK